MEAELAAPGSLVRFGIVGPGRVAEVHATALARIPGACLAAVAGRSPDRTSAFADRFGARPFASVEEMIHDGAVDAVIVATPHPRHPEAAIAASEAGCHVVVEKPMALTVADCDRMIDAAKAAGVVLSIVSQRRWYPAVRRVKAAIDDGRIGGPALATLELLGWRDPDYYAMDAWRGTREGEGGGVLVNQAVHQLDLLSWFTGAVAEVDGLAANLNHPEIEVEDSAVAVVRFANGALGSIVASNSQRPGLWGRIHVHGRNGASVGVETDAGSSFVAGLSEPTLARNDVWTIPGEETFPGRWAQEDAAALAAVDIGTHFHELQLRDVVAAIRDGRAPAVSGEDGRATVALMAAVYDAATTGGRIAVES
ncbi:MAG TPA: Gfo/Idh/MocA family oxidoreductase [Candidatus Limnocylindrales bacterium]|nr:Gfo/Idh/MocA family oxidoreductase [Candidatus Limnocylindrales bacterium]